MAKNILNSNLFCNLSAFIYNPVPSLMQLFNRFSVFFLIKQLGSCTNQIINIHHLSLYQTNPLKTNQTKIVHHIYQSSLFLPPKQKTDSVSIHVYKKVI